MSVTNPTAPPKPIGDVEQKLEGAVPGAVRPEVTAVIDEGNQYLADEAAKAPAAEAGAAQEDPAVEQAAKDLSSVFRGGAVPIGSIVTDGGALVKEVKAGYKTTEFWITAGVIVLSQVAALSLPGQFGPAISEIAAAASAGLYAHSRGLAKS